MSWYVTCTWNIMGWPILRYYLPVKFPSTMNIIKLQSWNTLLGLWYLIKKTSVLIYFSSNAAIYTYDRNQYQLLTRYTCSAHFSSTNITLDRMYSQNENNSCARVPVLWNLIKFIIMFKSSPLVPIPKALSITSLHVKFHPQTLQIMKTSIKTNIWTAYVSNTSVTCQSNNHCIRCSIN
jgi:hypothetical protein